MTHTATRSVPSKPAELVVRAVLFAVLWGILTGWKASGWWLGLPAIAVALYASFHLRASLPLRFRPLVWLRFARFFFVQSVMGGIDVARRALHPDLPINPAVLAYELNVNGTTARVFFVNVVDLLPGTLCAQIDDTHLTIHTLDDTPQVRRELRRLETLIGELFNPTMPAVPGELPDG